MLFHVSWDFTDTSDEGQRESLAAFSKWQPGPGQFQAFYGFADGRGGVALIEADDAATLARTLTNWTPWLIFEVRVVLPIQESAAIGQEGLAWREANSK